MEYGCDVDGGVVYSAVSFVGDGVFFVDRQINNQLEKTIITSTDKAVEICQMRIDDVVAASKTASYLPTIRASYGRYLKNQDGNALNQEVTLFLTQQYNYNTSINMTVLYFTDQPEVLYHCYANNNRGSFAAVQAFKENAMETIQQFAPKIDTDIAFLNIGGRVYLVRNIMDSSFHAYGVIVMELNMDNILMGLDGVWGYKEGDLFVDGISVLNEDGVDPCRDDFPQRRMRSSYFERSFGKTYEKKNIITHFSNSYGMRAGRLRKQADRQHGGRHFRYFRRDL